MLLWAVSVCPSLGCYDWSWQPSIDFSVASRRRSITVTTSAYFAAKWHFASIRGARGHAGPLNTDPLTAAQSGHSRGNTEARNTLGISGWFTFWDMFLQKPPKVCACNMFQCSWYHHMLSGWVKISYVSSQLGDGTMRQKCLKLNPGNGPSGCVHVAAGVLICIGFVAWSVCTASH